MISKHTICNAAVKALLSHGKPMTANEIYSKIVSDNLYKFHSEKPLSVLKAELRKHSEGVVLGIRSQTKYFQLIADGSYWLKDKPLP